MVRYDPVMMSRLPINVDGMSYIHLPPVEYCIPLCAHGTPGAH